ncbi:MAG: hypothetical protein HQ526_00010 [Actinobacteria bacterium]|nr:hypothetical protein [Actinomycetota bacterium]
MLIDCETCVAGPTACSGCVVSVLLGPPADGTLGYEEQRAIGVLSDSGLVPPLRLVPPESGKMAG